MAYDDIEPFTPTGYTETQPYFDMSPTPEPWYSRFGLRAFATFVLMAPMGRWVVTGDTLPEWAIAGMLGAAAAAGAVDFARSR